MPMQKLRAENDELRERIRQLEKVLRDPIPNLWNLPLTKMKSRMLGVLYRTPGIVTRERLRAAIRGLDSDADTKVDDVHLSQLRRTLRPHGIRIETVHDSGYRLPPESRARLAGLINQQARVAAAAIKPVNGAHQNGQRELDA